MAPIPKIALTPEKREALLAQEGVKPWYVGSGSSATQTTKYDIQRWARGMLGSSAYRTKVEDLLLKGELPVPIHQLLYYYAYGKPTETVVLKAQEEEDLSTLSLQELQDRAAQLQSQIHEVRSIEDAINAEFHKIA